MTKWPHDDERSLRAFYGDPDAPDFARKNIVTVVPPFKIYYAGKLCRGIAIHRKCVDALKIALDEIWRACGKNQSAVDRCGISDFSGSYNNRSVRGASRHSCHAFGAAIDFNASKLPMGSNAKLNSIAANAFLRVGAFLGQDFIHRKDPMHVQFANENTVVADASEVLPYADDAPPVVAEEDPVIDDDTDTPPQSILTSKIAGGAATVGVTGGGLAISQISDSVSTAAYHAQDLKQLGIWDILVTAAHKPIFWMGLAILIMAGVMIYWRWRDHGRGNPNV